MIAEAQFYRRAEEWVERFAERDPVLATQLGIHRYDHRLGDRTLSALEEEQKEIRAALAELRRYTTSPTQPQSYRMGKRAILERVADYRRAHPDAPLRQIHDAILGCGSLPPRLMRERLL